MVKISPISGITYNLDNVTIDKVIAPPYDVIPEDEQEELYNLSQYNIVKLILGKTSSLDDDNENRYTRSAKYYEEWKKNNVLIQSEKPCIYYYIQNYTTPKGKSVSRKGFIAKALLEEFSSGSVVPHEYTMGGPKADRLKLMKACKANFSQIFMIYSDPLKQIDKALVLPQKPFIDVTDKQGIQNIVYIIDDETSIAKISELMKDKSVLIADGHHRYETGLAYRDYMRSKNPDQSESGDFNHIMCYFTNLDDDGLQVFPTHRIITKPVDIENLLNKLKNHFNITEHAVKEDFMEKLEDLSSDNIVFGICFKNSDKYLLAELKDKEGVDKILEEKQIPDILRKLDLTVLHKIVIGDILGISEEDQIAQNGVKYIKKEEEAFEAVQSNSAEIVFIMASPKIQDIKEISQAGHRMPQKSTYFYPKLLSGLVINPL